MMGNSKNLKRFIKILLNKNKLIASLAFLIMMIVSILDLCIPQITRMILDNAIKFSKIDLLLKLIILYGLITVLSAIFNIVLEYIHSAMKKKVSVKLKIKLLKHLSKLSGSYYTNIKTGNILSIIENDMFAIENFRIEILFSLILDIFTAMVALLFLVRMQFDLLLIVIILQLLLTITQVKFTKIIALETGSIRNNAGNISNLVQEYVSNIMNIVISKSTIKFFKQYINKEKKLAKKCIKLDVTISKNAAISSIISNLIIICTYGYGGLKIIKGEMTLGELIAFQQYTGMLIGPCIRIIKLNTRIQQSSVSINRMFSLLDEPITIKQDNKGKRCLENFEGDIVFNKVSFSYNDNITTINNIDMKLEKGKITALVGTSGSGKSTISKLLFRLWDIDKGSITIDGVPLKEYNLKDMRKNISIITQDVLLFDDSIMNNLTLRDRQIDKYRVEDICKKVGISSFIKELPNGFETKVGEGGVKLSGGQKQRISIARALLSDSKIIVFDEATSALDNISQNQILKNIKEFIADKTSIVIAHRLSTIKDADKIYVLDNGNVVEEGSHSELIERNEFYSDFLTKQTGELVTL